MNWETSKIIKKWNIQPVSKDRYLSDEWLFHKPLSNSGYCSLSDFRRACHSIEDFFASLGTNLKTFDFWAGEYSVSLSLKFSLKDSATLQKYKPLLYWFFEVHFPVTKRKHDWMADDYIHQCLSGYYVNRSKKYTRLSLVLDFKNDVIEYPSHDFFCLSHDLMIAQKAA